VAGSCEQGNEPSVSIKCGEFFDLLLASQEGLCFMELVSQSVSQFVSSRTNTYKFGRTDRRSPHTDKVY